MLRESFPARYFAWDFPQLVADRESIEADLMVDVVTIMREVFLTHGWESVGEFFQRDDDLVRITAGGAFDPRTLDVFLQNVRDPRADSSSIATAFASFGQVHGISITYSIGLAAIAEMALPLVTGIYETAYATLEKLFPEKYVEWRYSLVDRVYMFVDTLFEAAGLQGCVNRYWLSLTDIKNVRFRYQFNADTIRAASKWLKQRDHAYVSPYHGLSLLIAQEAHDAVFAGGPDITSVDTAPISTVFLRISRLPHIQDGLIEFAHVESELYQEDQMACIELLTAKNRSLQLNCPAAIYPVCSEVIARSSDDIARLFSEALAKHDRDLREMQKRLTKVSENIRSSGVRDFVAEVLSRVISSQIPGGGPL